METIQEKHALVKLICGSAFTATIIFIPLIYGICDAYRYDYYNCNITTIKYPNRSIYLNDTNWDRCSCGKNCSSYNPTIDIYATIKNVTNSSLLVRSSSKINHTFFNSSCPKIFNHYTIELHLNNSKYIYNKYINNTISCYYYNNNIYLDDKTIDLELIIVLICILCLLWCCSFCCCYQFCK